MSSRFSPHVWAVIQALFVTALWSSSWVLIKIGLADIPALPFAGLRYVLAFVCILPFAFRPKSPPMQHGISARIWFWLLVLGVLYYSVTQGAVFLSLQYLPAMPVSLLLSFTPILVAGLGITFLGEMPTWLQWAGSGLYLAGLGIYFYPLTLPQGQPIGFAVAGVGVLANALSAVLGRYVNRSSGLPPLIITVISMGVGAFVLLAGGIAAQGWPELTLRNWLLILWLAVVNGAFAFTLWNNTLRTLTAMESSVINNTMLFQIALLAWLFLGETLTWRQAAGMALAGVGALVVQLRR